MKLLQNWGRLRSVMMLNPLEVHRQSRMIVRHTETVWSTANASHQAVTSQTHWHYIANHPHSVHTVTLITTLCKKGFWPHAHMHPFQRFSHDRELSNVCIWWIMYELRPSKLPKLLLLLLCRRLMTFWQLKGYLFNYSRHVIWTRHQHSSHHGNSITHMSKLIVGTHARKAGTASARK